MKSSFLNKAEELNREGQPYVMAFVIRRKVPSSGKPGDKAVIDQSGNITGWIGGGCTRGIVLKEAFLAMQDGKPRVVRISTDNEPSDTEDVKVYPMTCHSGGTVELYIEPVMPKPKLIVFGKSHVAMALNRIARAMDYSVTAVARDADQHIFPEAEIIQKIDDTQIGANDYVIVCTQGEADELALLAASRSEASYVSFVASRKKAHAVFQFLREHDVTMDRLKQIQTPAGLNINAKTPEEVAISILAQIIEHYRSEDQEPAEVLQPSENSNLYINPVCGVPVDKATAKHVLEYKDEKVYFCCDGCKVQFEAQPDKYMAVS